MNEPGNVVKPPEPPSVLEYLELLEYAKTMWPVLKDFNPRTRREDVMLEIMCNLIDRQGYAWRVLATQKRSDPKLTPCGECIKSLKKTRELRDLLKETTIAARGDMMHSTWEDLAKKIDTALNQPHGFELAPPPDEQYLKRIAELESKLICFAEALIPVRDWYESDEHPPRADIDILKDVVADLQSDREEVLRLRKSEAQRTGQINEALCERIKRLKDALIKAGVNPPWTNTAG